MRTYRDLQIETRAEIHESKVEISNDLKRQAPIRPYRLSMADRFPQYVRHLLGSGD